MINKKEISKEAINRSAFIWIKQKYFGFIILFGVDVIVTIISVTYPVAYKPYFGLTNTITYTVYMYFITIKGKMYPEIYQLKTIIHEKSQQNAEQMDNKLCSSKISENELFFKDIAMQTTALLENEKLYLEFGLTISDVAEKLNLPSYIVS